MASIRDLKKDVKYMIGHFIEECYTQLAYSPGINQENTLDIISDALLLRDEIVRELNTPPESVDQGKNHYNRIAERFYHQIIELTERLNSIDS